MSDTPYCTGFGYHAALLADHIEELEAENKRLRLEVAHANDTADAAIERTKELEAKLAKQEALMDAGFAEYERRLAKAVEALDEAVYLLAPDEEDMAKKAGVYRVVTTLAELKGETDE